MSILGLFVGLLVLLLTSLSVFLLLSLAVLCELVWVSLPPICKSELVFLSLL